MDYETSTKTLAKEYIENNKMFYRFLKIGGYNRVEICNGEFAKKSLGNKIYAIVSLIVTIALLYHILSFLVFQLTSLMPTELIINATFTSYYAIGLLNITYFNKRGIELMRRRIDVDCLIGLQESKFLRDQESSLAKTIGTGSILFTYSLFAVMAWVYQLHDETVLSGILFYTAVSYLYVDISFCIIFYVFITLRLTYVNMTLVKLTKMNPEYLVDHYSTIFWRKHFEGNVDLHERATPKHILKILQAIIDLKAISDDCFSCMWLLSSVLLIAANFIAVQNLVLYMQSKGTLLSLDDENNVMRLGIMCSWSLSNWVMGVVLVSFADLLQIQSKQTRLICSNTILNTSADEKHLSLCESVLSTLEISDLRTSVYNNIFTVNISFILNTAASVSVYTVMQLQLAFGI